MSDEIQYDVHSGRCVEESDAWCVPCGRIKRRAATTRALFNEAGLRDFRRGAVPCRVRVSTACVEAIGAVGTNKVASCVVGVSDATCCAIDDTVEASCAIGSPPTNAASNEGARKISSAARDFSNSFCAHWLPELFVATCTALAHSAPRIVKCTTLEFGANVG